MELGQRLRQARLEAGLSQRQLCGREITRNMLSQIENGSARPSMDTLRYLAGQLEKPVSFFLEEQTAAASPNQSALLQARQAWHAGQLRQTLAVLENFQEPDPVFTPEAQLLTALSLLALAEEALTENRLPYALELLARAEQPCGDCIYLSPELNRRRLLLLAQALPEQRAALLAQLPADDRELLLRAETALEEQNHSLCCALLEGAGDKSGSRWNLLRAEVAFATGDYRLAAKCYQQAEDAFPAKVLPKLEQCWLRLEDYKMAYLCACRRRELDRQQTSL